MEKITEILLVWGIVILVILLISLFICYLNNITCKQVCQRCNCCQGLSSEDSNGNDSGND